MVENSSNFFEMLLYYQIIFNYFLDQRSASPSLPNTSSESRLNLNTHNKSHTTRNNFIRHSLSNPAQVNIEDKRDRIIPNETTNFLTVSTSATPLIQSKRSHEPRIDESPVVRRREHLDWILVDPQKEFEAILSKISDQRGTFV